MNPKGSTAYILLNEVNLYVPLTCLQPSCSIISGGNTLDANALLKMALNCVSNPPIPILEKSQSGLMMDCLWTLPLDFPVRNTEDPSPFSNVICVFAKLSPHEALVILLSLPCWIALKSLVLSLIHI